MNNFHIVISMTLVIAFSLMTMVMFASGNLREGFTLLLISIGCLALIKSGKGFAYENKLVSAAPLWINVVDYDKSGNLYLDDGTVETISGLKDNFEATGIEFTDDDNVDIVIETYYKHFISGPIHIKPQKNYKIIMNKKYYPYDNQEVLR